jgi:hypothetical protein
MARKHWGLGGHARQPRALRRWRWQPQIELLEPRFAPCITSLNNGVLSVTLDMIGDAPTLAHNDTTQQLSIICDMMTTSFPDAQVNSVQFQETSPEHVINLENTLAGKPVTVQLGSGADTVNLSPTANNLNNIQGPVTITGGSGAATINVDDQANTATGQTDTLTATSVTRTGAALISYTLNGPANNVVVNGDAAGKNTYNILSTATIGLTKLNLTAGSDTVNVGSATNTLDPIVGKVNITGAGTLNINDQGNTNNQQTYSLSGGSVTRTSPGLIAYSLSGGTPSVVINGGSGTMNTYNVTGTAATAPMTLIPGDGGGDTITVGSTTKGLDGVLGKLTINAGKGTEVLNVNDQASQATTAQTYTLGAAGTSVSVTRSAVALITYNLNDSNDSVVVNGNSSSFVPSTFNVNGTAANAPTTLNPGGGSDTINVGSTVNTLDNILGNLVINGGPNDETFSVNDQGTHSGSQTYAVTSTPTSLSVTRSSVAKVTYTPTGPNTSVVINAGSGGNTLNVDGTPANAGTTVTVNAGTGVNALTLGSTGTIDNLGGALLFINGQNNQSTLAINDTKTSVTTPTYTITANTVSRTGGSVQVVPINYSNVRTLAINANGTFAVQTTSIITTVSATTAATVNVGNSLDGVQEIKGLLTVNGPVNLTVDDSADDQSKSVTITANTISGLAPAAIDFTLVTPSSLAVLEGPSDNTVTVKATPTGIPVSLKGGGGLDVVTVSSASSVQDILGALTLSNPGGATNLTVDDSADLVAKTVTLDVVSGVGTITGLAPTVISYQAKDLIALTVSGGRGGNALTINGTPGTATTTVNAGAGLNTIQVGSTSSGTIDNVGGALLVINGQNNQSTLAINDTKTSVTTPTYTVTANTVTRTGGSVQVAPINYSNVRTLTINANGSFAVQTTSAITTINATTASTVYVGNPLDGVQEIKGLLTVNGPVTLTLDDTPDSQSKTVTITEGSVTGLAAAAIDYSLATSSTLSIFEGPSGNTVTVKGTPVGVAVSVKGGGKLDLVTVSSASSVQDILGPLTLSNPGGATNLTVDDSADLAAKTVTLDVAGGVGTITGLAPTVINYQAKDISVLTVSGGRGGNSVTINGTPSTATTTVNAGAGLNTIQVGGTSSGTIDNVGGVLLAINGQNNQSTLVINDTKTSVTTPTYTITANTVSRTGGSLSIAPINYSNVRTLTISANGTFAVQTTSVITTVNATTASTVNVGNSLDGVQEIKGLLTVSGPVNLTVDDSADDQTKNVTITANTISGLAAAAINFTLTAPGKLAVLEGPSDNTVTVKATPTGIPVSLKGGGGLDVVTVGSGSSVQDIQGALTLSNPGGATNLTVDDSADLAAKTVTLDVAGGVGTITGLAPAVISYQAKDISALTVSGGRGGNALTINGTPATATTTVNAGAGLNAIQVGSTSSGTIDNVGGALLVINGQNNQSTLTVNDTKTSVTTPTYTVTANTVTRAGGSVQVAPINYSNVRTLTVNGNGGFTVVSTSATLTTLNAPAAAAISVGNSLDGVQEVKGVLNVGALSGQIKLTLDDTADPQSKTVAITTTAVTGLAPSAIAYSATALSSLTVEGGGNGGNTFNVQSTAAGDTVTIQTGPGEDAVNVGSTINTLDDIGGPVVVNGAGVASTTHAFIDHSAGFASHGDLQANNGAGFPNGVAELTDGAPGEARSIFRTTLVDVRAFQTTFFFQSHGTTGQADGMTFTIQGNNPGVVGLPAAGLGYQGIGNSVAVLFDFFNNGTHLSRTGLGSGGALAYGANTNVNFASNDLIRVDLSYDGTTLTEVLEDTVTGQQDLRTYTGLNIPAMVGGNQAFVGFTGGTGSNNEAAVQDVRTWTYTALGLTGINALTINDQASSPAHGYTITGVAFSRVGGPLITYSGISRLTLNGGAGGNTIAVVSTAVAVTTTVNAGTGVNTITLGSDGAPPSTSTIDGLLGTLIVNGQNNQSLLTINDQTAVPRTFTITADLLTRADAPAAPINYNTLRILTINANGTFAVPTTSIITTLNASKTSTVNVGNPVDGVQEIKGLLTVNGPVNLTVDDSADAQSKTVTITAGSITGLAAAAINYTLAAPGTLTIREGSAANTLTVKATPMGVPVALQGGGGLDAVTVGSSGSVQDIKGMLTITNPGGTANRATSLTVDDSADPAARTVTLDASGGFGTITGLAPAVIRFGTNNDLSALTISGGRGGNTITIASTPANAATAVNAGAGLNTITVGSGGKIDNIKGSLLTINGQNALSALTITDQNNTARTFKVTSTLVTRNGTKTVAPININYSNLRVLTVNGGSNFSVESTSIITFVNTAAGAKVVVGNRNFGVQEIKGAVFVAPRIGGIVLTVDDSADLQAKTAAVTTQAITGLAPGAINFGSVASLTILGSKPGGNTFNVQSIGTGTAVTIQSGLVGGDTVNVGNVSTTLDDIRGPLTVNGQGGTNALNINDTGSVVPRTYAVSATQVARTGGPTINYANVQRLALNGGGGGNLITILGTAPGAITTVSAGTGLNDIEVGAGTIGGVLGALNIDGKNNQSILNINDQTATRVYTISANSVSRADTPAAPIVYSNVRTLTVTSASVFNVISTSALTTVSDATGVAVVNVGNTSTGVQEIKGILAAVNAATLNVSDAVDPVGRTVLLGARSISGLAPAVIAYGLAPGGALNVLLGGTAGGSGNIVTITNTAGAGVVTTLIGGPGNETVNVQATTGPLFIVGGGADLVQLGTKTVNGVQGIKGAVNVTNVDPQGLKTQLIVDDLTDTIGRAPTLSVAGGGSIIGLAPAAITYNGAQLSSLTVNAGSGGNNFTITGTTPGIPTTLNTGKGADKVLVTGSTGPLTINLGSGSAKVDIGAIGGALGGIGLLTVAGAGSGGGMVTIHDEGFAGGDTYTITATTVAVATLGGFGVTYTNLGNLTLMAAAGGNTITVNGTGAGSTTVMDGAGGDTVNVEATAKPLNLVLGAGKDTVVISKTALDLNKIQGNVTVTGTTGKDILTINDGNNAVEHTYQLTSGSVSRDGSGTITFNKLATLTVNGGSGDNTYNILNTAAAIATTLNTGNGDNAVNVLATMGALTVTTGTGNNLIQIGNAGHTLDNIRTAPTINGGAGGVNTLKINDEGSGLAHVYSILGVGGGGTVSRDLLVIPFTGMQSLVLNGGMTKNLIFALLAFPNFTVTVNSGGALPDRFVVAKVVVGSTLFVNQRPGTDPIIDAGNIDSTLGALTSLADITGTLVINGSGPDTVVNLNDQNATDNPTYTLTGSTFARGSNTPITFSNLGKLVLNGSQGTNIFNVQDTPATFPTILNSGTGKNTYNLGRTTGPLTLNLGTAGDQIIVSPTDHNLQELQGPVTINGSAGAGVPLVLHDEGEIADLTYTLSGAAVTWTGSKGISFANLPSGSSLTLNGSQGNNTYTILDLRFATTLNTGGGDDTVDVEGTNQSLTVIEGSGNDLVRVGDANNRLDAIRGQVSVTGGSGSGLDVVKLSDQGTALARTYTITASAVTWGGSTSVTVTAIGNLVLNGGVGGNNITVNGSITGTTTINTGGTSADMVHILGSSGPVIVNQRPGTDPIIDVGNAANTLDDIHGPIFVTGSGSDTTLRIHDEGNTNAHTYTVTAGTVMRDGGPTITYGSIGTLIVNTGTQANTINVLGTAAGVATTVNTGNGNDTIQVGSGGPPPATSTINSIQGPLTINGGTGNDVLGINDQSNATNSLRQYILTATTLTRSGDGVVVAPISFNAIHTLNLFPSGGTIEVKGTAAGTTTTITLGTDNTTVVLVDDQDTLNSFQGPLTVNGGTGPNLLSIDDDGNPSNETYTLTDTTLAVARLSTNPLLTYHSINLLVLNAGPGFNTVVIPQGTVSTDHVQFHGIQALTISGGTFNLTVNLSFVNVTLSSGTLTGPGTLTVTSAATWTGGTMSGSGTTTIVAAATLTISGSGSSTLDTRTLLLAGATNWTGSGTLTLANGALIDNQASGLFTIQGSGSLLGSGNFHNEGSLIKASGSGTTTVASGIAVTNSGGQVSVQGGTLSFAGAYNQNAGSTEVRSGAFLGGNGVNILGGMLSGSGTVIGSVLNQGQVNPGSTATTGILTIQGSYTQSTGGVLNIRIGGTGAGTGYDQLNVTGTATLAGTLNVFLISGFSANLGQSYLVVPYASNTGQFASLVVTNHTGNVVNDCVGFTAQYASTGLSLIQGIQTNTTLISATNPSVYGQPVTFTATVTPVSSNLCLPSGTVTFKDGSTVLGTSPVFVLGGIAQATFTATGLGVTSHVITAVYSGDTYFFGSTSSPLTQVVNQAATATLLVSSVNPSVNGQPVLFTATVSAQAPGSGAPTGMVAFLDGSTMLANISLANGTATFLISSLTVGAHAITARYSGDGNFTTSSATMNQTVFANGAVTHLAISAPPNVQPGMPFTATVIALDAYENVVTGYLGTIHFTCTDPTATLPVNYTFVTGDYGVHAFPGGVTLNTSGLQTLTVTDTVMSGVTGSINIQVGTAVASYLVVAGFPSPTSAGTPGTFTVTAKDASGNIAMNYRGTVHFTSSDPQATLPPDYAFTAADNGVHTFSATLKTAGIRSLTATDTVTGSITGTQTSIMVNAAAANTLLVSGYPSPVTAGTSNPFTVTAKDPYGNVAISYAGTVKFSSTDPQAGLPVNYTFVTADNGTHTFSATLKTAGTQSLTATDTANGSLTGTQGSIVVNPAAASALTVAGFPSPIAAGTPGNFMVTAKDPYGNVAPSYRGTIRFTSSDSQASLPGNYTFSAADNGMHSFSATLNTPGTQSITATDMANGSITGTQSGIVVTASAASSLLVAGFPSPITAGTPGMFTVTAKDGNGNVATGYRGTVHFTSSDPQAALPADYTFSAGDNGMHSFSATLNTPGTQSITATDKADGGITGTQGSIVVNPVNTNTLLTSSLNPSIHSQTVTFTATVSSGLGTPTGSVSFTDNRDGFLGQGQLNNGVATLMISSLEEGNHTVTAYYSGDNNYAGSTSNLLTQMVNPAATSTALMSSLNPSIHSQAVTFTATVTSTTPLGGTPTGSVRFTDSRDGFLGQGQLNNGVATLMSSSLEEGNHTITAYYSGDLVYDPSTSPSLVQTVNPATTSTAVTSSLNPSIHSQAVIFTATVTSTTSLGGTPTGSVSFTDSRDGFLGQGQLNNGVATLTISSLEEGDHTITAYYSGDLVYDPSTSPSLVQTVDPATTSTALASSPNPSLVGQAVTFTATVTSTTSLGGTPTGSVSFTDSRDGFLGQSQLNNGVATLTISSLEQGDHTITAYYSGDLVYDPSTSPPLVQTVNPGIDKPGFVLLSSSGKRTRVVFRGSSQPVGLNGFQDRTNDLVSSLPAGRGRDIWITGTTAHHKVGQFVQAPTLSLGAINALFSSGILSVPSSTPSMSSDSLTSSTQVGARPLSLDSAWLDQHFAARTEEGSRLAVPPFKGDVPDWAADFQLALLGNSDTLLEISHIAEKFGR